MKRLLFFLSFFCVSVVDAAVLKTRIKDIASFEGIRDNQLVGYGIVAGLNGTGDNLINAPFTSESLTSMLERLGVNMRSISMDTKNVAAVMVTATLPPFTRHGSRIDVTISTLGNAKSLVGGVLLPTSLMAADGEVYALAQGSVVAGGFSAGGQGQTVTKGVPTSGRISGGGLVEREVFLDLDRMPNLRLVLRNPDLTTANRICEVIIKSIRKNAKCTDPSTIVVNSSPGEDRIKLMTQIEQLEIEPDQKARVVFDDREGVVVINGEVKLSDVAVTHGNLTVTVSETEKISNFSATNYNKPVANVNVTQKSTQTSVDVNQSENKKLAVVGGATLKDLVTALNSLGCSPRDLITVLQAVKQSGALQAQLEPM